ncbi:tetratricopeptide repeat protein [Arenibacter algicola]|uniref:tetratricopeptide repeat-containing sensor histidine kinase n=1 Tax=Arenibacter algicola TaxID=616991 RepID=UPI001C06AAB1|nr:tetratricopeptide repeat protein [Arenibacter algicola]MBU2905046.1 tetratricopeptide repeat protein [Arenibacter algicola]
MNFPSLITCIFGRLPFLNIGSFFFFLIFTTLSLSPANAQEVSEEFKRITDSLIKASPVTYQELDSILKPKRSDTTYMRFFDMESARKKYLIGQSYALNQLGRKYRDISNYSKAVALHEKALQAAVDANNLEFRVYSLNMLGVVYRRSDAIKIALDYNQEALELAESEENPSDGLKRSINVSLNSIGNLYSILKQYDIAIAQFKKSMALEKELGNKLGLAINYQNIGECLEYKGELEEALHYYRTSLDYNNEIDSDKGRVICKNSIAQIYIKQNKLTQALEILEPNLLAAETLGDMSIIAAININIGWALMELKQYTESEKYLVTGLEMSKKHHLPSYIAHAYNYLSKLYTYEGEYQNALEYYQMAEKFNEEINSEVNRRYINDLIIKYETEKKTNQIEALARENEFMNLRLRKKTNTLIIGALGMALLTFILYILYRQKELKNEKQILTLEQSMLRSQMNPHFLFNSLNSIKLYIINNEKKNAVHYLNKFSKLVRKILEASSLKEISLADELETIDLYMNIENIRFSHEINFTVRVDESIDEHTVKIPSLILQPFLENALWHGLSSKEGEKKIHLHVSRENEKFIQISITDNGVGREASERIKESKILKRKSIGIDITKERLANFSKDFENSFQVEIIDLYDSNNVALGTKVVLHIPTH